MYLYHVLHTDFWYKLHNPSFNRKVGKELSFSTPKMLFSSLGLWHLEVAHTSTTSEVHHLTPPASHTHVYIDGAAALPRDTRLEANFLLLACANVIPA